MDSIPHGEMGGDVGIPEGSAAARAAAAMHLGGQGAQDAVVHGGQNLGWWWPKTAAIWLNGVREAAAATAGAGPDGR